MAKKSIRDLLCSASNTKPQKDGESPVDFRARLAARVGKKLSDEEFGKLPEAAQEWLNSVTVALKGKKEPPEFPDETTTPAEEPAAEGKKGKKSKKEKAPKGPKVPRNSPINQARTVLAKNLDMNKADFVAACKKNGSELSDSTLSTVYSHNSAFIGTLRAEGVLPAAK